MQLVLFILKFNDGSAGLEAMRSDVTARQYHWVPIKKREALFGLRAAKQQPSVNLLIMQYKHTSFSFGQNINIADGREDL